MRPDASAARGCSMAKYTRLYVLSKMIETGLVPVFYKGDIEIASKITSALLDARVRCMCNSKRTTF